MPAPKYRSGCPVSVSLDYLGDRWSLLIIRDLMVRGYQTFKEFQQAGENIATNILSDRLQQLEAAAILTAQAAPNDARRIHYRLTEKGISLAPVIYELLIWAGSHEKTGAPCAVISHMAQNREFILTEVRRRWEQHDLTPILPRFKKEKSQ